LPKFRHEILAPPVSFKVGPFRPIFLAKLKGIVLNCALKKWVATKVDICVFLLSLSQTPDFAFLLKRHLSLKIALST